MHHLTLAAASSSGDPGPTLIVLGLGSIVLGLLTRWRERNNPGKTLSFGAPSQVVYLGPVLIIVGVVVWIIRSK